jgi:hypothetical protein
MANLFLVVSFPFGNKIFMSHRPVKQSGDFSRNLGFGGQARMGESKPILLDRNHRLSTLGRTHSGPDRANRPAG